jgi:hypothetical protein
MKESPKPADSAKKESVTNVLDNSTLELATEPKNVPQLLSLARSEHLGPGDGRFMKELTELFGEIGRRVYGGDFVWSSYNKRQWEKFCSLAVGPEGGACMFSMEAKGELPYPLDTTKFRGMGMGLPVGMYPYSMMPTSEGKAKALYECIAALGYDTDLVPKE